MEWVARRWNHRRQSRSILPLLSIVPAIPEYFNWNCEERSDSAGFLAKNPNNDTTGFGCTPLCRWGAFSVCGVHFICQRCTPGRRCCTPAVITAFSVKAASQRMNGYLSFRKRVRFGLRSHNLSSQPLHLIIIQQKRILALRLLSTSKPQTKTMQDCNQLFKHQTVRLSRISQNSTKQLARLEAVFQLSRGKQPGAESKLN